MVQILGKYQYASSENFDEFIKILGQSETAASLMNSQPTVEIKQDGDQWIINVSNNEKTSSTTFKLNEPYDEHFPSFGHTFKSITTKEGEGFRTETHLTDAVKIIRLYEFSDSGMKVHLSTDVSNVTATRTYKRL